MTRERPPARIPATPEYVLAKIQDEHRLISPHDPEAEPEAVLTAETTIAEYRDARDLLPWRALGRAENTIWGLDRTDAEWKAVLEPARKRTLGGLCAFIAESGATRPVIEPAGFLGANPCRAAGAFLAVRSILREAGADADAITPAMPLAPFLKQHGGVFLGEDIAGLAPGAVPPLSITIPQPYKRSGEWLGAYFVALSLSLVVTLLAYAWLDDATGGGRAFFRGLLALHGAALSLIAMAVIGLDSTIRSADLERFALGELQTFKDLARALAAEPQG